MGVFGRFYLQVTTQVDNVRAFLVNRRRRFVNAHRGHHRHEGIVIVTSLGLYHDSDVILVSCQGSVIVRRHARNITNIRRTFAIFRVDANRRRLPSIGTVGQGRLFPRLGRSALPCHHRRLFQNSDH